jgi:gluconate 2-dehydrogenase gamma chain
MEEKEASDFDLSRREALKVAATGLLATLPLSSIATKAEAATTAAKSHGHKAAAANQKTTYLFFNKVEAAFIEASVARLIPADEKWGGAVEAGVPNYIDKQLGGSWGAGERLYRSGPWQAGTKTQGYQLPYTPAELFRTALRAIDKDLNDKKTPFAKMSTADQDTYLKSLETGDHDLGGVPGKVFFSSLLQMTVEGFFSDPVYGGNKDMISWKMIGFPGAYGSYFDIVEKHGIKITRAPMSLAEDSMGHVHVNPNIPAR